MSWYRGVYSHSFPRFCDNQEVSYRFSFVIFLAKYFLSVTTSRVPEVKNDRTGVRLRFKGLYFLTVGFRDPFATLFLRYSYQLYCACVITPHTNVWCRCSSEMGPPCFGAPRPHIPSDMGPGRPMSLEIWGPPLGLISLGIWYPCQ